MALVRPFPRHFDSLRDRDSAVGHTIALSAALCARFHVFSRVISLACVRPAKNAEILNHFAGQPPLPPPELLGSTSKILKSINQVPAQYTLTSEYLASMRVHLLALDSDESPTKSVRDGLLRERDARSPLTLRAVSVFERPR